MGALLPLLLPPCHAPLSLCVSAPPSPGIATLLYCLMALAIVLMVPYYQIDTRAPFSAAFQHAGMGWAARIVSAGAVTGVCVCVTRAQQPLKHPPLNTPTPV